MTRNVGIGFAVLAVLLIGALLLYLTQSNTLSQTEGTLQAAQSTNTRQAADLSAEYASGTEVAALATEVAGTQARVLSDEQNAAATAGAIALATQSALAGQLATEAANLAAVQSDLSSANATATLSAENASTAQANAAATQSALEASLFDANAASTVSAENAAASATAQQESLEIVQTSAASTQAALQEEAINLQNNVLVLQGTASDLAENYEAVQTSAAATQSVLQSDVATSQAGFNALDDRYVALAANATIQADQLATARAFLSVQSLTSTPESQTSQPTPTVADSTPVVSVEITPSAGVAVGNLLVNETFESSSEWVTTDVAGGGNVAVADGQYVITIDTLGGSIQVQNPPVFENGYVEFEADLSDCDAAEFGGFFFRKQSDNLGGYLIVFPCDLSAAVVVRLDGGDPFSIGLNRELVAVDRSQPHTLGIRGEGENMSVYIDGREVLSVSDATYPSGTVGFYAAASNAEVVVRFDNLHIWELP